MQLQYHILPGKTTQVEAGGQIACTPHSKNYISISFHIFSSQILNQMQFYLVQNRKKNCHHNPIPFNLKGNENRVFSLHAFVAEKQKATVLDQLIDMELFDL